VKSCPVLALYSAAAAAVVISFVLSYDVQLTKKLYRMD
jgi:hypothetical protein